MDAPQTTYAVRFPRTVAGINRVGQQCIAVPDRKVPRFHSRVRFADGAELVISRYALRRLPSPHEQARVS